MLETKPSKNAGNNVFLIVCVIGMLLLTFLSGVMFGYYFYESRIINRLNTQFEAMGMGLCNISQTYIQINDDAWITYFQKNQTQFIE